MNAYRALVVGAGAMGKAWALTLREHGHVEQVGWVDIAPGIAEAACNEVGLLGIATGADYPELLDELKPDFVIDVTPPEVHSDVVAHALDAGYPVLGEKPMAHTLEAAREMVAASDRSGKLYMVSQSRRYQKEAHDFRELLGQLGALGILNVDFFLGPHFGGFRDEMPSPLVLDMAIHTFDMARFLTGLDAVAVYCDEFNPAWSWYKGDACANAIFELSNGARYVYRGSWCSEGLNTTWEGSWRAVGEKGSAIWDRYGTVTAELFEGGDGFMREGHKVEVPTRTDGFYGGISGSLREFLSALETGAKPNGECHDNVKSLAMVFGAIESSRQGKRVRIEGDRIVV